MSRLNRIAALVLVCTFAMASHLFAQTRDENWAQCMSNDADVSLNGCDAVLNSGEEGPRGRFAAFVNRGIANRDLGLNAQAVADFTQAISLNGADVDVLLERGATYGQDGEFEKAIHDYDSALDLEGDNPAALYARGVFKRLRGNSAGGDADIAAARRLDPDIATTMADRGITETNLQAPQTAKTPVVPPDPGIIVPPDTSVKAERPMAYPLLLLSAGLVLALVLFVLLRRGGSAPPHAKRPGAVTALGVTHLIGSGLGLISIFGFVDFARRTPQQEMSLVLGAAGVLFGLCLLSLACGIGLLRLRPYGRSIQLGFAWVGLLAIPLGTVLSIVILYYLRKPAIKALFGHSGSRTNEAVADVPENSPVRSRGRRTVAIVTGIAALFLIGVVVGRQTGASTNEPVQSQFAFGLLNSTGNGVDGPYMTERDISDIFVTSDSSQRAAISISFTPEGASKMRTLTSRNIGRDLVFVIDGSPDVAHPTRIQSAVGENASLSFISASDAQAYVSKLKASRDPDSRYR